MAFKSSFFCRQHLEEHWMNTLCHDVVIFDNAYGPPGSELSYYEEVRVQDARPDLWDSTIKMKTLSCSCRDTMNSSLKKVELNAEQTVELVLVQICKICHVSEILLQYDYVFGAPAEPRYVFSITVLETAAKFYRRGVSYLNCAENLLFKVYSDVLI
jgi:hypothetical protein